MSTNYLSSEQSIRNLSYKTMVILIGFQYDSTIHELNGISQGIKTSHLLGILIDLYQAYKFTSNINNAEVLIVTDIESDNDVKESIGALGKDVVDSGILFFISEIKEKGIYLRHRDLNWLTDLIKNKCKDVDRLLLYYSGHAREGYMETPPPINEETALGCEIGISIINKKVNRLNKVNPIKTSSYVFFDENIEITRFTYDQLSLVEEFPAESNSPLLSRNKSSSNITNFKSGIDDVVLPQFLYMETLRDICFSSAKHNAEMLFIFDCCNSTGLNLPFYLESDGILRLSNDTLPHYPNKKLRFFTTQAICISSTKFNQDSVSTVDGSPFTVNFFKALFNGERNLSNINNKIIKGCHNYNQDHTIYTTYPNLVYLWSWLYGKEKEYRITIDRFSDTIVLVPLSRI